MVGLSGRGDHAAPSDCRSSRSTMPAPGAALAGEAGDDHVEDGDDAVKDGTKDGADGIDDAHEAAANSVEDAGDLEEKKSC